MLGTKPTKMKPEASRRKTPDDLGIHIQLGPKLAPLSLSDYLRQRSLA